MTQRKIKVGVFGVGALGQHHARIYAQLPETELVGLYDVDVTRAAQLAQQHGCRAFGSVAELAAAVEAASVVVPTHLHHAIALDLMDRGLHLLVEKPIASTTAEAEAMVGKARENGVILQVGHVERFNPVLAFLEQHARAPRFIEAHRLAPFPPPREGLHPRDQAVELAARSAMDAATVADARAVAADQVW